MNYRVKALAAIGVAIAVSMLVYYFVCYERVRITVYPSNTPYAREVARVISGIAEKVEEIRELKFPREARVVIVNLTWVMKNWGPPPKPSLQDLYREYIYKLTLLLPLNYNFTRGEAEWASSIMAATSGYTLYIVKENFNPNSTTARRAIAHELTHILQYKYFHIHYPSKLDARLAIEALVEGDADFVADLYCNETGIPPRPHLSIPVNQPYIALQSFPYIYGEDFIAYLYKHGGWSLVNKAYKNPPVDTDQVMHPKHYIEGVKPVKTMVSWNGTVLYRDSMGEYYILLTLASKIGLEKAEEIASGWRGDSLVLCNYTGLPVVYWNITWSSHNKALLFAKNYIEGVKAWGGVIELSGNGFFKAKIGCVVVKVYVEGNNTLVESTCGGGWCLTS